MEIKLIKRFGHRLFNAWISYWAH